MAAQDGVVTAPREATAAQSRWRLGRVVVLLAVAAVVVVGVRSLLVQSFVIPSGSMEPTLQVGDRVLVSRLDYRLGAVRRGDVIVFDGAGVFAADRPPARSVLAGLGQGMAELLGVPVGQRDYVKRVIGLPGDRVACCDAAHRITVNGRLLVEPYVYPGDTPSDEPFDIRVPPGRLWVMGDHRSESGDSREHLGDPGGGTVPLDHVVGRVVTVWWPLGHAGGIGRVDPAAQPKTAQEASQ